MLGRRPWRDELAIIDRTMKAISSVTDPEKLVETYWRGIGELLPFKHFVSVSRRGETPPNYLVTRSSRFKVEYNPWTERSRLPRLQGGILGEVAFAEAPVIIEDLPSRLRPDDPGHFYLEGFKTLAAMPQYDDGVGLNVTMLLLEPDEEIDLAVLPLLHWQTGLFGRGTQNLVLRNQLDTALTTLHAELNVVGEIQRSLLPAETPRIAGFDVAAFYHTSARAGGDYYDFFELPGGRWGVLIVDVSGHGTPAAVLMAIIRAIAHTQPEAQASPSDLLRFLNAQLVRSYAFKGSFATAMYAVLDPATRTLTFASAGHNPARLLRSQSVIPLEADADLPLGIIADQTYATSTIGLKQGDHLAFYTDGITEAMTAPDARGARDMFGTDRLDRAIARCAGQSASECVQSVRHAVNEFAGGTLALDDQTLLILRCL
jgi:sigma-B regulation protein RsbU (phosphoserine phosphatase)